MVTSSYIYDEAEEQICKVFYDSCGFWWNAPPDLAGRIMSATEESWREVFIEEDDEFMIWLHGSWATK